MNLLNGSRLSFRALFSRQNFRASADWFIALSRCVVIRQVLIIKTFRHLGPLTFDVKRLLNNSFFIARHTNILSTPPISRNSYKKMTFFRSVITFWQNRYSFVLIFYYYSFSLPSNDRPGLSTWHAREMSYVVILGFKGRSVIKYFRCNTCQRKHIFLRKIATQKRKGWQKCNGPLVVGNIHLKKMVLVAFSSNFTGVSIFFIELFIEGWESFEVPVCLFSFFLIKTSERHRALHNIPGQDPAL